MPLSDLWKRLGSPQLVELTALLALIFSQKRASKKKKGERLFNNNMFVDSEALFYVEERTYRA